MGVYGWIIYSEGGTGMNIFYPDGPRPDMSMSGGGKARRARSFRKKAVLVDVCLVLAVAAALLLAYLYRSSANVPPGLFFTLTAAFLLSLLGMLAGEILAFRRCPFCGKKFSGRDWSVRPFFWRAFRCPECDFEPFWDKSHSGCPPCKREKM